MYTKLARYVLTTMLVLVLALALVGIVLADKPVTGAISTTDNPNYVGPEDYVNQACLNGQGTNCNIYADKRDVWFSGLPVSAAIGEGTYFFAVLEPGGQGGNDNPNDGTEKNLSDDFDAYTNRIFSVDGLGNITAYDGTHNRDGNLLQLFPYADTTNPGGEYILAVCSLADGYPVDPNNCKYDAFKIKEEVTPPAKDLVISKTATPSYDKSYAWSISKSVDQTLVKQSAVDATFTYTVEVLHDAGVPSNWQVTGQITVENPNLFDVSAVTITDTVNNGGVCAVNGGESLTVPGMGSIMLDYICTYAAVPAPLYGTNTAVATWFEGTYKHVSFDRDFDFSTAAPNQIDECVNVTDSMGGSLGTVCIGDANPTVFTYAKTVTGVSGTCTDFNNTATFATNDTGASGSAQVSAKLCVGADLQVSKTATPFFTRTYNWDISKSVDKTVVKQFGGTATFNYTVNAWQTGFVDSDWALTGTITVTNPNDWEAVTADLSDDLAGCTLEAATVTVAASESVDVPYTCAFTSGASGTNTATASWDSATYFTPSGSAAGAADFAFVTPTTTVNKTVTVTDTFRGVTITLGTLTATDAEPYASQTFTYSYTVAVPTWNCVSYTNTAKIVETGQSDSQTVRVCGPIKTGALTMGFWQNKNGQAIITGGASVAGVCKSGTWLRQYAPFQDLSATATCAQVGSYVTNVIKAANASGASMNAMLKAQMLATALDVYFSAPDLGGNKINAPKPIGDVAIDLTKICKDLTCTAFENSSSVFGGTPKTVQEMLAYAASKSNVGGSVWYANVKTTQELAKDAFDAINNEKVFAP